MKTNDPRLKIIAIESNCNALVIAGIAGMIKDGISLDKGAEFSGKSVEAMRPVWGKVADLIRADKDGRAAKKVAKNPSAKVKMTAAWQPSEDDIAYAKARGFEEDFIASEIIDFRHYWISRGDARNWSLTWQNWIRRRAERNKATAPEPPKESGPATFTMQQWRTAIETFEDIGYWPPSYGPPPDSSACRAPRELLMRRAS